MFSAHVGPGHEISDVVCRVTICQFAERLGQPVVRVNAADLAVFDERGDHRPGVAAIVGSGEQSGLPGAVGADLPDKAVVGHLDRHVVHRDESVKGAGDMVNLQHQRPFSAMMPAGL